MGSEIKGSANVAGQIGSDLAGQTCDITDETVLKVNGDATDNAQGITIVSEDGTEYKLGVTNAGGITTTALV